MNSKTYDEYIKEVEETKVKKKSLEKKMSSIVSSRKRNQFVKTKTNLTKEFANNAMRVLSTVVNHSFINLFNGFNVIYLNRRAEVSKLTQLRKKKHSHQYLRKPEIVNLVKGVLLLRQHQISCLKMAS